MVTEKNLIAAINVYGKQGLSVITCNKKHSSKQVVPITPTREKTFLQLLVIAVVSETIEKSKKVKKPVIYFGLHESFLKFF